jgi:hypothetical protein
MTLDDPTAVQALSSNPAVSYAVFNPAGTTLATADGSRFADPAAEQLCMLNGGEHA